MIRNVLLFLAGVVVTLGLLYVWPHGRSLIFGLDMVVQPPGSGIRVVGGSLTAHLVSNGYSWSTDLQTQLGVTNADASTVTLENVSEQPGGPKLSSVPYFNLSNRWTIVEYVKDTQDTKLALEIVGSPGVTISSGTVTLNTPNNGDSFRKSDSDRIYHNKDCPSDDKCPQNKVDRILVKVGGVTDIWYCADNQGYCHVDIGGQH